jgi:3-oxoadipate enol-lactonase
MPHIQLRHRPDIELWVEDMGAGGVPLLLLNGMSQTTANWRTQMRRLAEDRRVVAYDARNQGRSTVVDEPVELDDHVADLVSLLDSLELERVVAVGFSHGARIALALAARAPARISALSLTGTGAAEDSLRDLMIETWSQVLRLGGVEAMAWCALPDILGRRFLDGVGGAWEPMVRATVQRNHAVGLSRLLQGLQSYPDALEDAAGVRCPAQLMVGREDRLVSAASATRLATALRLGSPGLEWFEGVGHTVPIEAPEDWRRALHDFLTRLRDDSASGSL